MLEVDAAVTLPDGTRGKVARLPTDVNPVYGIVVEGDTALRWVEPAALGPEAVPEPTPPEAPQPPAPLFKTHRFRNTDEAMQALRAGDPPMKDGDIVIGYDSVAVLVFGKPVSVRGPLGHFNYIRDWELWLRDGHSDYRASYEHALSLDPLKRESAESTAEGA